MTSTAISDRRKWLALAVLGLALAITVLDVTVVNVTIPAIQRDLSASLRDVEWITALYALVYGAFILPWGKLSDQHGRRRVFIAGVAAGFVLLGALSSLLIPNIPAHPEGEAETEAPEAREVKAL